MLYWIQFIDTKKRYQTFCGIFDNKATAIQSLPAWVVNRVDTAGIEYWGTKNIKFYIYPIAMNTPRSELLIQTYSYSED